MRRILAAVVLLPFALLAAVGPSQAAKPAPVPASVSASQAGQVVAVVGSWPRSAKDARLGLECRQDGALRFAAFWGPEETIYFTATGRQSGSAWFDLGWGTLDLSRPASCVAWVRDYVGAPYTRDIVTVAEAPFTYQP